MGDEICNLQHFQLPSNHPIMPHQHAPPYHSCFPNPPSSLNFSSFEPPHSPNTDQLVGFLQHHSGRVPDVSTSSDSSDTSPSEFSLYEDTPPSPLLQFNCNGLKHCSAELNHFLEINHIIVVAIQETKFTPASKTLTFPGYSLIWRPPSGEWGWGSGLSCAP